MKRTIERHINELKEIHKQIRDKRTAEADSKKRIVIDHGLRATVAAITHYELALQIDGLPDLRKV